MKLELNIVFKAASETQKYMYILTVVIWLDCGSVKIKTKCMYLFLQLRVGSGQYYGHFFLDNNLIVNAGDMMNKMGDDAKDSGNEKEDASVRGKWIRVQRDLENERRRNERLYHAFLPRPLAMAIQKGEYPEAGNYTCCKCYYVLLLLFCIFASAKYTPERLV